MEQSLPSLTALTSGGQGQRSGHLGTWGFPKLPGQDLHWSCLPSISALSAPRFCSTCKMQITANILKFMLTCQTTNLPAAQLPAMFGFLLNCLQTASFIELVGLCFPGGSFPPSLATAFAVNPRQSMALESPVWYLPGWAGKMDGR